jgi:hypothetical protein
MVALNNINNDQKLYHLNLIKESAEELIIVAALHAGVNPETIDTGTHPLPDSFDTEAEDFNQLDVNLAERVKQYNDLVTRINSL